MNAAIRLLEKIKLRGQVVTGDALYAQLSVCERIVKGGGDYLVVVKRNQPRLYEDIALLFEEPPFGEVFGQARQEGRRGDRYEVRRLWASSALQGYLDRPCCRQVCKLERGVQQKGKLTAESGYLITSLAPEEANARRLLNLRRGHWRIENCLHYVRDVTMGEDLSQVRKGAAPRTMTALRNTTLGLLRRTGVANIAAALRQIVWKPGAALELLR